MIDLKTAEDIHLKLYIENDYTSDVEKHGKLEHWEPGLDGDCEDFAGLLLRQWLDAGADSDKCGMAFVRMNGTGEGHAVAWIDIDGTQYWTDCNSSHLRPMDKSQFTWVSYMRMHAPTHWYQFA